MYKPKNVKELTQQQWDFTQEYIKNGFNAYRAALKAGYSYHLAKDHTHNLTRHPLIVKKVEQAIAKIEKKQVKELSITWEWKLKKLKRVINEFIPDDKDTPLNKDQVKVGLAAIAEHNKMVGEYAPERRLSVNVDATKEKLKEAKKVYDEF